MKAVAFVGNIYSSLQYMDEKTLHYNASFNKYWENILTHFIFSCYCNFSDTTVCIRPVNLGYSMNRRNSITSMVFFFFFYTMSNGQSSRRINDNFLHDVLALVETINPFLDYVKINFTTISDWYILILPKMWRNQNLNHIKWMETNCHILYLENHVF